MAILVLAILLAAWGLVLGPAFLRQSLDPSPIQTEMNFRRALRAIGPGSGRRSRGATIGARTVLVPRKAQYPVPSVTDPARRRGSSQSAADRRRSNLTYLAGFIVATFLLGLLIPPLGFLLYLNIAADVVLVAYLVAVLYYAARPPGADGMAPTMVDEVVPPEAAGGAIG